MLFAGTVEMPDIPGASGLHLNGSAEIAKDGTFTITDLLPGVSYRVLVDYREEFRTERGVSWGESTYADAKFNVTESGQEIDLGELNPINKERPRN